MLCRQGLLLLGSFAVAFPASAQTTTPIPPQAYGPVWTGFYVGAAFGGGGMVNRLDTAANGISANFDGAGGSGVLGSIYGGFDYQIGPRAVVGALAELTLSSIAASASASVPAANASVNSRPNFGWAALVRAGFLANPSTLLYLVGGYAGQNMRTDGYAAGGGAAASFSRDDTVNGWTIGPGFETLLGSNLAAKLEYRYSQFGRITLPNTTVGMAPSTHAVRAGLTYKFAGLGKFGGPGAAPPGQPVSTGQVKTNWTGIYAGVAGGGGLSFSSTTAAAGNAFATIDSGGQGLLGSVFAGADYQFARQGLAGIMADFTWSGLQSTASFATPLGSSYVSTNANRAWSVMGRVGYLPVPSTLLYAAVGYTGQNILSTATAVTPVGMPFASRDTTFNGWAVAPGVETVVTGGWTTRLEYRYSQYGRQQVLAGVNTQPATHTIRAGLSYKFGVGSGTASSGD